MLESYRLRMATLGSYEGEARRRNAQKIMDASWMRDAATKPVYVKWVDSGLPVVDDDDIPVYAKYNVKSYYSVQGDSVEYLLQFRLEDLKDRPDIKVGAYIQMCNELEIPEWWLIVAFDDRPQFRQFYILKCTWIFKWVSNVTGKRIVYQCLGCARKQNSYNSGVWLDYVGATVENQELFWVPTNSDTKTILYDTKFLKSAEGRYPPLAWKISKVEDTAIDGISRFTMTQEMFDPARDNAELGIANYWESAVEPEYSELEEIPTISDFEITYSNSPAVKAGGGYKKFSLKEYVDNKLVDVIGEVQWNVDFDGNEDKLECAFKDNVAKVKCKPDYSLIGKTFILTAHSKHSSKSLVCEVTSL